MKRFFNSNTDIFACIHFAAFKSVEESVKLPDKYFKNNVGSLEVLLSCLEKNKSKNLIFSSSCTVYGKQETFPISENACLNKAESPYGESKQKCEILITNNLCNSVSLRYFNPISSHKSALIGDYSKNKSDNLVQAVSEVASGIRDKLVINGDDYNTYDGTCVRDYIHVCDLARAHVSALDYLLKYEGKHIFNVGTGKGLSVFDVINIFEKVNNMKINYVIGPRRKGDIAKIYSDCKLIKKELKWKPIKTIEESFSFKYNLKESIK
tara:strand:- start:141 stop:938 length:798 start_codon:yes stop_codon:yes gene_type:complete